MLVEDEKSLREIYSIRLAAEGYNIVSAGDGEEALALAVQEKPDLIISDVMMPKISGFDMLDILRSQPETAQIKVIMMTALSSDDQRARGENLGADRYLVKSQVGIEDLTSLPQFLLHQSRQLRQISLRRILPRQPLRQHRHQFQLLNKSFHRTQPISRWLHQHQLPTSQFQSSNLPKRQLHLLRQHRLQLQPQPHNQHHNQHQHLRKQKAANVLFNHLIPTSTILPPAQNYRVKWTNC